MLLDLHKYSITEINNDVLYGFINHNEIWSWNFMIVRAYFKLNSLYYISNDITSTEDDRFSIFYWPFGQVPLPVWNTVQWEIEFLNVFVERWENKPKDKISEICLSLYQRTKIIFTLDRNILSFSEGLALQTTNVI